MSDLQVPGRSSVTKSNNTLPAVYNLKYSSSSIKKKNPFVVACTFSSNTWEAKTEITGAYLDYIRLCPISFASTFEKYFILQLHKCVSICGYVPMSPYALRSQRGTSLRSWSYRWLCATTHGCWNLACILYKSSMRS